MGYVESNLLKGERIERVAQVHWWAWGKGVMIIFVGMALAMMDGGAIAAVVIPVGLLYVIRGVIIVMTTELVVTNRRVIAKFGLIRRSTVELIHGKVEGMTVDQSIFGRLLGFGTIVVNGTGTSRTPIPHIARPLEFRKDVLERIELQVA